jgi:transposase
MTMISSGLTVYLAMEVIDMRKSIDGLASIVQASFRMDPFSCSLFVFCNRERNKIKILQWEHNGFWLHYKRLEKGRFRWPSQKDQSVIQVTQRELGWLLDGLTIDQRHALKSVRSTLVV